LLLGYVLAISSAWAGGVSPYIPMKLDPGIERQIERLMVIADMPQLIKPFRATDVLEALERACDKPRKICQDVDNYLTRYKKDLGITQASVSVSSANENNKFLPNQRGITTDSSFQASANGFWQPSNYLLMNLGAIAYDDDVLPTAYLSFGFDFAQVDIGWRDYWYSPFQDSAMLISTNAQASPSIAVSNNRPFPFLNLRYEFFLVKLEETDGILFEGTRSPGRPLLAGIHIGFEPVQGLSIGLNRVFQFGGAGRSSELSDIFDAFFDPSGADNADDSLSRDDEVGNQIASITTRFNFPGKFPFSVYMEYAGEDTSRSSRFRLGNTALSLGLFFPQITENIDITYEYSDWQNAWYVNGIYANGYTNERSVIGHWAANERTFRDAIGAQIHTLKLNWSIRSGHLVQTTYRTIENESYSNSNYVRSHELQMRYSFGFRQFVAGLDLYVGSTTLDDDFLQAGAFLQW